MTKPADFENDLRLSPRLIAGMLALFALALTLATETWPLPPDWFEIQVEIVLFYGLAVLVWLVDHPYPRLSRWLAVAGLAVIVGLGLNRLNGPEYLSLLPLPTVLAAVLLGLVPAGFIAGGQTLLLVVSARLSPLPGNVTTTALAALAIWSAWGVMVAVYRPRYQMNSWFRQYFRQARAALEEARNQKVELAQTLQDLALANRQLILLNERLEALQSLAEEAQQAKTTFVAKVSHELRTPLNMIIGIVDVLTETPDVYDRALPSALMEDLEIVRRNCNHLSSMINDILDLSQTETGRLVLHREWVNLVQEIESALTVVRPLIEKKSLALTVNIEPDLPSVYCDRTRIRQVILNLLSNAARYTDSGGITVQVQTGGSYVQVSITDTGPGIKAEDARRIFDPFFQSTAGPWQDKGGSGLGLSISKQFIERHQGEIWVESQPGQGSTFAFKLPVSPASPQLAGPARWLSENWLWYERTHWPRLPKLPYKQRVIIFDETGGLLPLLEPYADEVELVSVARLEQVHRALVGYPAHAVIINTDSLQTAWAAAEDTNRHHPDTPVIGCTFPARLNLARQAGAVGHLTKPVTLAALKRAFHSLTRPVRRVLVVDDAPDIRSLLSRMLNTINPAIEVITAADGRQALHHLRGRPPDLVLLDIALPDMDGWQVLAQIRQSRTLQTIPVIVVSAEDSVAPQTSSPLLLAAFGAGISGVKLLRGALEVSAMLLKPETELGPTPE